MATFTRPPNVPPEATVDPYGNWFLPNGEFVASSGGQTAPTPAQTAATPGPVQTEPGGKKYRLINGQKWYLPPMGGNTGDTGGGLIHGRAQWNPQTGAYDTPLDWGKILSMVAAGIITAGAADAILSSTPALAATAPPGASAAASAPVLEGVAAGGAGATTVPAGAGAAEAGAAGTAGVSGWDAAGNVVGNATGGGSTFAGGSTGAFNAAGDWVPAASRGLSYADILKGVVPTAGNLVGGLIQAHAAGAASDAQQKYLEEALAYQKESDQYNRQRQATLDAQEVQRYGDYQGRIAPFIANGTSSNDRMAALLGLPARSGSGGGASGPPASQRVASDPATQAAIRHELQVDNSSDDPAAWDEYLASHGDSATKNWDYWKHRIDTGDGVGKGYAGGTTPPPTASAPPPSAASVSMRAPDGSVKTVPADQVAHYQQLGATVVGAAA